jgi:elongation factor Ts
MEISAALVKELREKSNAGIMDCKNALAEAKGNFELAFEILRKKGIASAQRKIGKSTLEGIVEAYIHPGNRLGVLEEINCETDFVAKTREFRNFVKDIAMQVAASNPMVINREQISKDIVEKELEIYRSQASELKKPAQIVEKIALGKLEKFYQEVCLLEQQFIKDPTKTVKDVLLEFIGKIGENVTIKRFSRYRLGENI